MNYTWTTTIHMKDSYFSNAITVISAIVPSLVPNIFILYVGLKSSVIRDKFRDSIVTMTCGNLFAGSVSLLLHFFYLYAYFTRIPVNFLFCTFLRRFSAFAYTPMLYGSCLVAMDRFYCVCLNRKFSSCKIFQLTVLLWAYPFVIFMSQLTSNKIRDEDICGPTKGAHLTWMIDINTGLFLGYPVIALGLNTAILVYLYKNTKRLVMTGTKVNALDIKQERHVVYGMLCQSFIPLICQIPMLICLLFMYREIWLSKWIWTISNVIWHANLTLNPIFTVIFVKQFRSAVYRMFKPVKITVFPNSTATRSRSIT